MLTKTVGQDSLWDSKIVQKILPFTKPRSDVVSLILYTDGLLSTCATHLQENNNHMDILCQQPKLLLYRLVMLNA